MKFNDNKSEVPEQICVHELFERQVKNKPDRTALIFEEKNISYQELDLMTNSLAHYLRENGVKRNDIVPIMAVRNWRMIVAMMAVLKAGGAFMLIAPDCPKDRIHFMLGLSEAQCCIGRFDGLSYSIKKIDLERFDFEYNITEISNKNEISDICYIVFTSGSTGEPKAITIEHKNVINLCAINDKNVCSKIIAEDAHMFLSVTNPIFDMYITESLLPLVNGITILLANEEQCLNQKKLNELCDFYKPDIFETTPTKMKIYMKDPAYLKYLSNFRAIILGGERFSKEVGDKIREYSKTKIFNNYGPAETTVWSTIKEIKEEDVGSNVTVGNPIINTQRYILDQQQHICPIGVAGELCIAGEGVGKGYYKRPLLTNEKFVRNPFVTQENGHGKVMYKTGDLARWKSNGEIEFLGRMDTQVKIRGLRIELGEIENIMNSYQGIQLAAVTDRKDERNWQYLVGYYISEMKIDEKKLRTYLLTKLPQYMVPNLFMRLETIPMTSGGKLDKMRLPIPKAVVSTKKCIAPQTIEQKILCQILEKLFELETVGIEDNFFEIGGDSLKAIEYTALAYDKGIEFSLQNIYDYPTVKELCVFLKEGKRGKTYYHSKDLIKYDKLLRVNVINKNFIALKKELGNILLTGATGFLGVHILEQLIKNEKGKIYCLVRCHKSENGFVKLQKTLQYYFGEKYDSQLGKRIIPIIGNIELGGLSDNMPEDVQTVIHTAASVKHYGSYDYFYKSNVQGTLNVVNYTKRIHAKLIHISTLSVSGNGLTDEFSIYKSKEEKYFSERSFYIEQPLDNVYVRSKFEAERVVFDAMMEGVDAKIVRVGNLTNRYSDYCFQPNYRENAFLTRVKALLEFGMIPDYLLPLHIEFSPIDLTALGVVLISQYADKQNLFHLNSNKAVYFERLIKILSEMEIVMNIVEDEKFKTELQMTIKNPQKKYIFEAFQNDMDENGKLIYDTNINIENEFTLWFLKRVGFEWGEIDREYLRGYIDYFRGLGYLSV